ncbi:MAG TPA: hypothetical protein VMZ74_11430, partial [Ramlibacter sp.]|nr:hypothetical protein [Ramlibacter sp.]
MSVFLAYLAARSRAVVLFLFLVTACTLSFALSVGDRVQANGTINVRNAAAGTSVGQQTFGSLGTITGGPQGASLSGTFYTWWNVNFDSGVDGWVADIGINAVAPPTPSAPTPSSPSNGEVVSTLFPTLFWSGGSNFASIQINVSKSPFGSANLVYTSSWLSSGTTSLQISNLVAGTSYRWDVTVCSGSNGSGTCVTSSNATFSTQSASPTAPSPISPSGNEVVSTLAPTLIWSGGSNFASIQINVSKSPFGSANIV